MKFKMFFFSSPGLNFIFPLKTKIQFYFIFAFLSTIVLKWNLSCIQGCGRNKGTTYFFFHRYIISYLHHNSHGNHSELVAYTNSVYYSTAWTRMKYTRLYEQKQLRDDGYLKRISFSTHSKLAFPGYDRYSTAQREALLLLFFFLSFVVVFFCT